MTRDAAAERARVEPKPRLLDLFCGAGGCSVGYARAGFEVVGVDLKDQPNYPYEFHQGDALDWALRIVGTEFNAIHASPPCQAFTTMSNRWRGAGGRADTHDALIGPVRGMLQQIGLPYVIENVPGARKELRNPIALSGGSFGLGVDRLRFFECSFPVMVPPRQPVENPIGIYGKAHDGRLLFKRSDGTEQRAAKTLEEGREAMGIDWMDWRELAEAIPPSYTEHIGHYLMQAVKQIEMEAA